MNRTFQVDPADPSLLDKLKDRCISLENDLCLIKKTTQSGQYWELSNIAQRTHSPLQEPSNVISGTDLIELMTVVANGKKEMPQKFQAIEFQKLTKDPKFRDFARLIPGIESEAHRIMREKIAAKAFRAYENAKIIGNGLSKINRQGFSGRFIGKDQEKSIFLLWEVVLRDRPVVAAEAHIICSSWLEDEETDLSILEWEESKRKEWGRTYERFMEGEGAGNRQASTGEAGDASCRRVIVEDSTVVRQGLADAGRATAEDTVASSESVLAMDGQNVSRDEATPGKKLDFLPWLAQETWNSLEKKAWQKAHPGREFDETYFIIWKKGQIDKEMAEPTWFLKKLSGKENDIDFANWREDIIKVSKHLWEKFKKETGLNICLEKYQKLSFEHYISGSIESAELWILRETYRNLEPRDRNKFTEFTDYVKKLKWKQEIKEGVAPPAFKDWEKSQNDLLIQRYEGSGLPVDFKKYKAIQDDELLNGPAPFILLNEQERTIFKTTCEKGRLVRNKTPFNTSYDRTHHSGSGYAIFVIGSDQSLYTGSHIRGIFHHSSFLGAGALMAAGEIKTTPDGTIIELSSKSGHYLPTEEENLFMLNYFKDKGVDLSQIKFTAYKPNGTTEEYNAQGYLDELEKVNHSVNIRLSVKV